MRIANAPVSWGALEFDTDLAPVGFGQVLDEIKESGYDGTELGDWGFMPTDPLELRGELAARELTLIGGFVPVPLAAPELFEGGQRKALETARLLVEAAGPQAVIVLSDDNGRDPVRTLSAGRGTPEMGLSDAGWVSFAAGAERIARAVLFDTGLRTVFHHHSAGFVETPQEVERLMELTDPSLLGLCLDTGHYQFASGDPVEIIRHYEDRIWHIHFKDCHLGIAQDSRRHGWDYFESVHEGVFCELGRGEVDFPSVVGLLDAAGYNGWIVVEQDVLPGMGSPLESAIRNREYLRSLGL